MAERITKTDIQRAQEEWALAVVRIGALRDEPGRCRKEAEKLLVQLYAFDLGPILFKPTLAKEKAFRTDLEGALSYFVGGCEKYPEDQGFALKAWKSVSFENKAFILEESQAWVMGHYFFSSAEGAGEGQIVLKGDLQSDSKSQAPSLSDGTAQSSSSSLKVEYTFGYIRDAGGSLKIRLHHSSQP